MSGQVRLHSKTDLLVLIHLPWLISEIFNYHHLLSYFIAWLGSFFIFYLTIFSKFSYPHTDQSNGNSVMRPVILIQLIFAGFMCSTSIFYVMDQMFNAYQYNPNLIAKCQRLSLLAHTALMTGIISMSKRKPKRTYEIKVTGSRIILLNLLFFGSSILIEFIPVFIQFKYMLLCLSSLSSTYILVLGIVNKNVKHFAYGFIIFCLNLYNASSTGYKEIIITNFIVLLFLAYPHFKKTVLTVSVPVIILLLYALPTFTSVIRMKNWKENTPINLAREQAYSSIFNEDNNEKLFATNHAFLTTRLSEISMFMQFVQHVPEQHAFYGSEIIKNSLYALVPRGLWQEKPITEEISMERVYDAGVADRSSTVSAKSRPVTDGYLMAGMVGVYMLLLLYGLVSQRLCSLAENLFGGYNFGCVIIFNGIFQQLWRGNNLEFLLNNVVYGFSLLIVIFYLMKGSGFLTKI
jgi:hypothetical protein